MPTAAANRVLTVRFVSFLENPVSSSSARFRPFGLGRAAYHAEPHIVRRRRAVRFGIRGAIGAAADRLAPAVARERPLGHVAPQIVDRLLVIPALAVETAHWLQQRRRPRQLFGRLSELGRILGVWSITRPVVECVLALALLIEALHFVFVWNSVRFLGLLGQPLGIGFGAVDRDGAGRQVRRAGVELVALVEFGELRPGYLDALPILCVSPSRESH